MSVYARWRPLAPHEAGRGAMECQTSRNNTHGLNCVSINSGGSRAWSSPAAFRAVYGPEEGNGAVYDGVVARSIARVLRGETCSVFAYGHSGSGKTHTILGYDFGEEKDLGLCVRAARELFAALDGRDETQRLGIGLSVFELRSKTAFDLLNERTPCFVREGADGRIHIRGATETLDGGRVRVRPIAQQACWDMASFQQQLVQALAQRATGSSSVHDESSRTHAVVRMEVVNQPLVDARSALVERQSELVPVGKLATDIMVEEDTKSVFCGPDGKWVPNPDYRRDQARIDAIEVEKAQCEARVAAAEGHVEAVLQSSSADCLGAKMVFVDLAGAEYYEGDGMRSQAGKQTAQERRESRQINSDLLALKEVMRAWSQRQKRVPFRSSTLTMVLREHFAGAKQGSSAVVVTVSPALGQFAATLNALKYASLVGAVKD